MSGWVKDLIAAQHAVGAPGTSTLGPAGSAHTINFSAIPSVSELQFAVANKLSDGSMVIRSCLKP